MTNLNKNPAAVALARKLMDLTNMTAMLRNGLSAQLDACCNMVQSLPLLLLNKEDLKAEFEKFKQEGVCGIDNLLYSITELYADAFSIDELHSLVEFYQSPVGQAILTKVPALQTEAMRLGESWAARISKQAEQFTLLA